jgi:hypothetical protein
MNDNENLEPSEKPVLRGSSVGIHENGVFITGEHSTCPRYVLARIEGLIPDFSDAEANPVFYLGRYFETWFKATLTCEFIEEYQVTHEFDNIKVMGHADIVAGDLVYELKSVSSVNVERELRLRNKFKPANLVQLVFYMLFSGCDKGLLIYGDYTKLVKYPELKTMTVAEVIALIEEKSEFKPKLYTFEVSIEGTKVLVDGEDSGLDTTMILDYILEIGNAHASGDLPPAPVKLDIFNFYDSCQYCPFTDICWEQKVHDKEMFFDSLKVLKESVDNTIEGE